MIDKEYKENIQEIYESLIEIGKFIIDQNHLRAMRSLGIAEQFVYSIILQLEKEDAQKNQEGQEILR